MFISTKVKSLIYNGNSNLAQICGINKILRNSVEIKKYNIEELNPWQQFNLTYLVYLRNDMKQFAQDQSLSKNYTKLLLQDTNSGTLDRFVFTEFPNFKDIKFSAKTFTEICNKKPSSYQECIEKLEANDQTLLNEIKQEVIDEQDSLNLDEISGKIIAIYSD